MTLKLLSASHKVNGMWTYAFLHEKKFALASTLFASKEEAIERATDALRQNNTEVRLVQIDRAWFPVIQPVEYE